MPNPFHVEEQKDLAAFAFAGERVIDRMLARLRASHGSTITTSHDEFAEIGVYIARSVGITKELSALRASGVPSRGELINIVGHLKAATDAITVVNSGVAAIVTRNMESQLADQDASSDGDDLHG